MKTIFAKYALVGLALLGATAGFASSEWRYGWCECSSDRSDIYISSIYRVKANVNQNDIRYSFGNHLYARYGVHVESLVCYTSHKSHQEAVDKHNRDIGEYRRGPWKSVTLVDFSYRGD